MYDCDTVPIIPFEHQVGGHKVVLQISKTLICKPREEYEVKFYKKLPKNLKDCVPNFKGEIEVQCIQNGAGFQLQAKLPTALRKEIQQDSFAPVNNNSDIDRNGHVTSYDSSMPYDTAETCSSANSQLSDWSRKCLERTMHSYGLWSTDSVQQFVVLENLLADHKFPCVLDIKLGRKQRVYDCSEAKRKLLESRCAHSTSASLGFRICGMQLYQKDTGEYISQDKYVGRALDDQGAVQNLKQYFNDGVTVRTSEIHRMLDKLKHLHKAMSEQHVFHFLSVSLLLIYDSDSENKVDARLIDFANAISRDELPDEDKYEDYNEDLLFGISSIINILHSFLT